MNEEKNTVIPVPIRDNMPIYNFYKIQNQLKRNPVSEYLTNDWKWNTFTNVYKSPDFEFSYGESVLPFWIYNLSLSAETILVLLYFFNSSSKLLALLDDDAYMNNFLIYFEEQERKDIIIQCGNTIYEETGIPVNKALLISDWLIHNGVLFSKKINTKYFHFEKFWFISIIPPGIRKIDYDFEYPSLNGFIAMTKKEKKEQQDKENIIPFPIQSIS